MPHSVVLMVDDNPADVLLMRYAVETTGQAVELRSVPDGSSAVEYLHRNPAPDLLVLDFFLNGETGPEVLHRIQADMGAQPRAVMLSGVDSRWAARCSTNPIESHQKPDCLDGWLELAARILCPPAQPPSVRCCA